MDGEAQESGVSEPGYELVRISREMVKQLLDDESEPVVVMRMKRHEDGTCELWLRKVVTNDFPTAL